MPKRSLLPLLAVLGLPACTKSAADHPVTDSVTAGSVTAGIQWPALATADTTIKFTMEMAKVHGLAVRDTEPSVRQVLGKPDSMAAYTDSLLGDTSELFFHGVKAVISEGRLAHLYCHGLECKNAQGIGVGSSVTDVLKSLGRGESGSDSAKRQLKYAIPGANCSLVLVFSGESVATEMNLLCRKRA